MSDLTIRYRFQSDSAEPTETRFELDLDPQRLEPRRVAEDDLPRWVDLDYYQCAHCPLRPDSHPHCPLALSLLPLVTRLGHWRSYLPVHLEVTTDERTVSAETTAQEAISSLMGLLIATSGCPHTRFLKPMARFHLPLSSPDETFYRVVSMYSLAQYFRGRHWLPVDFGFDALFERYEALGAVNDAVVNRLRAATREDGTLNAIVMLDALTQYVPTSLEDSLAELEHLFHGYLKEPPEGSQA